MSKEEEMQDWGVTTLTDDGLWDNGDAVTTLLNTKDKEVDVTVITKFKHANWENAIKACINCYVALEPETMLIHTEEGWVLPCRSCKKFVWYYEKGAWE